MSCWILSNQLVMAWGSTLLVGERRWSFGWAIADVCLGYSLSAILHLGVLLSSSWEENTTDSSVSFLFSLVTSRSSRIDPSIFSSISSLPSSLLTSLFSDRMVRSGEQSSNYLLKEVEKGAWPDTSCRPPPAAVFCDFRFFSLSKTGIYLVLL